LKPLAWDVLSWLSMWKCPIWANSASNSYVKCFGITLGKFRWTHDRLFWIDLTRAFCRRNVPMQCAILNQR
jgi:hypothetical protein